uniref:Exonuclease domain-containing protein n=1 Tax=Leersia perrieri TaxID=77586 RepID=A0A0D9XJJ9_9ORYZ
MTTTSMDDDDDDEGISSRIIEEEADQGEHEIVFFDVETSMPQGPGGGHGRFVLCRPAPAGGGVTALLHARAPCRPRRRDGGSRASRAPPFRHVADDIHAILHGRIWAGHNIKIFDSNIIREAFYEIGRPPPESREMIDTYPLLRQQFGRRAGDMKMASLADYFGLGHQIHRSLVDVRMNIDVLKCCATVLFLPDDVSIELIQVSLTLSYKFTRSISIKHNDSSLQLRCTDLRVCFEVRREYQQDSAGRWKLNIVVDNIPDNLIKVLEFCDGLAWRSSREFGSTSVWRPVIKEYGNRSTVRLSIPTTGSGDNETYATNMYQIDVAVLACLFGRGDMVDTFFSVELYDYLQNAGIRLVAKKLVV